MGNLSKVAKATGGVDEVDINKLDINDRDVTVSFLSQLLHARNLSTKGCKSEMFSKSLNDFNNNINSLWLLERLKNFNANSIVADGLLSTTGRGLRSCRVDAVALVTPPAKAAAKSTAPEHTAKRTGSSAGTAAKRGGSSAGTTVDGTGSAAGTAAKRGGSSAGTTVDETWSAAGATGSTEEDEYEAEVVEDEEEQSARRSEKVNTMMDGKVMVLQLT